MKKVKSVLLTSLIIGITFALVFMLYARGMTFWAFAAMSVCVFAACPLYYEKAEDPVVQILCSVPLVLLYAFVGMLIRYAAVSAVTTELIIAIGTTVLMYGLLFLALYLILYLAISYFLRVMNF